MTTSGTAPGDLFAIDVDGKSIECRHLPIRKFREFMDLAKQVQDRGQAGAIDADLVDLLIQTTDLIVHSNGSDVLDDLTWQDALNLCSEYLVRAMGPTVDEKKGSGSRSRGNAAKSAPPVRRRNVAKR